MEKKRDVHVTPHPEGGWQVIRERGERASSRHATQTEALQEGRRVAMRSRVDLVVHRPDGRIRDSDSFGNDPAPPRDRKH